MASCAPGVDSCSAYPLPNAVEFGILARLGRVQIPIAKALEITVLGSAANMLPLPGSTLVRVVALKAAGSTLLETVDFNPTVVSCNAIVLMPWQFFEVFVNPSCVTYPAFEFKSQIWIMYSDRSLQDKIFRISCE